MTVLGKRKSVVPAALALAVSVTPGLAQAGFIDDAVRYGKPVYEGVRKPIKRFFSEHSKVLLNKDGIYEMPLYYDRGQKSRVSVNFGPLKRGYRHLVQVWFKNVRKEDLPRVKATFLADKRARKDRPRSGPFRHGEIVEVHGATSRDRGYYVARLTFPGGREAFFSRNPNAELWVKPIRSWKH